MTSATHERAPRGALLAAGGLACFLAGVAASELAHRRGPETAPSSAAAPTPELVLVDAGAAPAPRIFFDPASITLLPDASLELALPPGFDAGR